MTCGNKMANNCINLDTTSLMSFQSLATTFHPMGKAGSPLWCWVDIQNVVSPEVSLNLLKSLPVASNFGWNYLAMANAKKSAKFP